jgi:hypothetical protein
MQATIAQFSDAWARCDIDKLMALMSDAPLYRTSGGLTFEGREAVRQGFARMCQPATSPPPANSAPPPGKIVFFDNKCLSYWTLTLPTQDGQSRLVEGIDVISFDPDGRIRTKDAYRKGT